MESFFDGYITPLPIGLMSLSLSLNNQYNGKYPAGFFSWLTMDGGVPVITWVINKLHFVGVISSQLPIYKAIDRAYRSIHN